MDSSLRGPRGPGASALERAPSIGLAARRRAPRRPYPAAKWSHYCSPGLEPRRRGDPLSQALRYAPTRRPNGRPAQHRRPERGGAQAPRRDAPLHGRTKSPHHHLIPIIPTQSIPRCVAQATSRRLTDDPPEPRRREGGLKDFLRTISCPPSRVTFHCQRHAHELPCASPRSPYSSVCRFDSSNTRTLRLPFCIL